MHSQQSNLTIHDYLDMEIMGSPSISDSESIIAYQLRKNKRWDSGFIWDIKLFGISQMQEIELPTLGNVRWSPKWNSSGGLLLYYSYGSINKQGFIYNLEERRNYQVTNCTERLRNLKWVNDSLVAYITDKSYTIDQDSSINSEGVVVGKNYTISRVWVQSIRDSTKILKIADDSTYISDFTVTPNGKLLAIICSENSNNYNKLTNSKIKILKLSGEAIYEHSGASPYRGIKFSPDGHKIAFIGNPIGFSLNSSLYMYDLSSKYTKDVVGGLDLTIRNFEWFTNNEIIFKTPIGVYSGILSMDLQGRLDTIIAPYWVIDEWSCSSKHGIIVFKGSRGNIPPQIMALKYYEDTQNAIVLTNQNQKIKDNTKSDTEVISYTNNRGVKVQAIVSFPKIEPGKQYPLLVKPHGGPDVIDMARFDMTNQFFINEGFIVFQPNYSGSIGYGIDFYSSYQGLSGEIDYKDIMIGLDSVIAAYPIDTTRMVVGGWSYGGTLTNFIIGKTNRFKAAVSVAGVSNTLSRYGKTDINYGEVADWEFNARPVLNPEAFEKVSPLYYLKNCQTPTLIMHGKNDNRVPVSQSWETYRALQDVGVPVDLVIYPNANHSISNSRQRANVYLRWVSWYKKYINN